ncbi:hypothetical protein CSUI_003969 [Cystoisospora suis]|uniref:PH domain-containing protein n=1 Tax=Cystoisospora suis TaxID=483139 RepID=A0A2C6L3J0_9APIC|nr:hypothetical protein CSUI_003969 [Cystoisospora suis]
MEPNVSWLPLSREARLTPSCPKPEGVTGPQEFLARDGRSAASASSRVTVTVTRPRHSGAALPVPQEASPRLEGRAGAGGTSREGADTPGTSLAVTRVGAPHASGTASSGDREQGIQRLRQAVLQSRAVVASRWGISSDGGRGAVAGDVELPSEPSHPEEGSAVPVVRVVSECEKSKSAVTQPSEDSPPKKSVPKMPPAAAQTTPQQLLVLKVKKKQPLHGKKGVLKRVALPAGPTRHVSISDLQNTAAEELPVKSVSGATDSGSKGSSGALFSSRPSFLLRFPSNLSDGDADDLNLTASGFLSSSYSPSESPEKSFDLPSSSSPEYVSSLDSFKMFRTLPKLPVQVGSPEQLKSQAPAPPRLSAQSSPGGLSLELQGQARSLPKPSGQARSQLCSSGGEPDTPTRVVPSSEKGTEGRQAEGEKAEPRLGKTVSIVPGRSSGSAGKRLSSRVLSGAVKQREQGDHSSDNVSEAASAKRSVESKAVEDDASRVSSGASGVDVSSKFATRTESAETKQLAKTAAFKRKQKKTRFVNDTSEPVPGVDPRVEELAAEEDFDRNIVADLDTVVFDDRLSPAVARLRQERLELARWVRRLREGRGHAETRDLRPEIYPKTRGVEAGDAALAANYVRDDFEPRLEVPLEPRGDGMEEILAKEAQMPSTAVWQLEQIKKANHLRLAQQQRHIGLLQKALRKAQREAKQASRTAEGEEDTSSDESGSDMSPREAERAILQEQCATLLERVHLEADSKDAYKRAVFAIQGQKDRTVEKYRALRDRLNAAHTVTRVEQAKREEEQENVEDLRDRLERKVEMLKKVTSTSEQYEFQLLKLQQRYEELARYLLEAQEKVSSYQEGLREARSNFEHEVALLQIEKSKTSRLSQRVKEQEKFIGRMEITLRIERDKVLSREKTIQDLREALEEKDQLLIEARDEVHQERERLASEQRQHEHSRVQIANLQQECLNREKDVELLRAQRNIAVEQDEAIERLADDFRLLLESSREQSTSMEQVLDEVEDRRQKALLLLHKALQKLGTTGTGGTTKTGDAAQASVDTLAAMQKLEADRSAELDTLRAIRDRLQKEIEEQRTVMQRLADENREALSENSDLKKRLATSKKREADLLDDIDNLSSRIHHLTERAISLFPAQGRTGSDSVVSAIRQMQKGGTFEKWHAAKKKITMKFIKLNKKNQLVWTAEKLGSMSTAKAINLSEIASVEFGTQSSACRARMEVARARDQEILPWRCFAIYTPRVSYLFTAPDDEVAAAWVVGLGRLVAASSTAPNITSRRELCLKRAKMKLAHYCEQRGISQVKMWKDALAAAAKSMPRSHGPESTSHRKSTSQHRSAPARSPSRPRRSSTDEVEGRRTIFRMTSAEKRTLMETGVAKQAPDAQPG